MQHLADFQPIDYLIIDCYYVLNRSYYSTPKTLTDGHGLTTNAIHGFFNTLLKAKKDCNPKEIIIALEGGKIKREEEFTDYKKDRKDFDEELKLQIPYIITICKLLGFTVIKHSGYEADDVIASACKQLNGNKVVFTTDKDIMALISEDIKVFTRVKHKSMLIDRKDIIEKWGVEPSQIWDVLSLCGDDIDSVPGIKGIGKSTAIKLIQQYKSLDNLIANIEQVPNVLKTKIVSGMDSLLLSKKLIALKYDLDITIKRESNLAEAYNQFMALGMKSAASIWCKEGYKQ